MSPSANLELDVRLTQQQRDAVLHDGGPLLIIAGPGSGKTEVLACRVAHLVKSGLVQPAHCLVSTFANKASLELRDRIQRKLPDVDVEQMPIGTIHSLCADILRDYETKSPVPRGFEILDEEGQLLLLYRNRSEIGLGDVMRGRPQDFFSAVLRMFNLATEELVGPEKLLEWCRLQREAAEQNAAEMAKGRSRLKAQKAADAVELWNEEAVVTESYKAYCSLLKSRNLVDFAFLQRYCLDLLDGHPEVVASLRERYQVILVDEYQDTNAAQERVLRHLAGEGRHLTVVGDDDQGIYRFRGATVGNLLTFEKRYPGARRIYLEQNFRSLDPIVRDSLTVIAHNPARFPKDLFTTRGQGSDIVLVYEPSVAEEASAIARFLKGLKTAGKVKRWGDVALLLRSVRSYSKEYAQALAAHGIPVSIVGEPGFFDREDISQLCNLFHFLGATKPWADMHARCGLMDLEAGTVEALKTFQGSLEEVKDEGALRSLGVASPSDRNKIQALLELKRKTLEKKHKGILPVFYELLAITRYLGRCQESGDIMALMNLGLLSGIIARFDRLAGTRNLYPFQDYLQLLVAAGAQSAQTPAEEALKIMTIHQAKGLEFPVVVMPSVMDGRLPALRRRDRYEVPYDLRASGMPEVEDPHLTDERKLFYVGATRAKELLILGTADVVNKRGGGPSPFLREMFGDDLHAVANADRARILEVESAPTAQAEPRERISFSQLASFLQCPVRYELEVVYGLQVPRPDPVGFGANVHRALLAIHERAIGGAVVSEREVEEIVESSWIPSVATSGSDPSTRDRDIKKAAVKQLRRYVHDHGDDLARAAKAEISFSFGLPQSVLLGRIDLVRRDRDGIEVVDFKTGAAPGDPSELEPVKLQLDVYSLGAGSVLGQNVTKHTAHFLGDGTVKSWPWNPEHASRARGRLSEMLGLMAARKFTPRKDYCPRCEEFSRICLYCGGKE